MALPEQSMANGPLATRITFAAGRYAPGRLRRGHE